jgi:hypothetical protein
VAEMLTGRCPAMGHPIYTEAGDPASTRFSCLCPGRADGMYATAVGAMLTRVSLDDPMKQMATENRREHITHICKVDG